MLLKIDSKSFFREYPIAGSNIMYLPLIFLHVIMPLHWNLILPEISKMYYVIVPGLILLLLFPTIGTVFIIFRYSLLRLRYKYLIFAVLLICYWILSQSIINYRINRHLRNYGIVVSAAITDSKDKETFVRHKVKFFVNSITYAGYIDSEDEIDSSHIEIIVSQLDPRIYERL